MTRLIFETLPVADVIAVATTLAGLIATPSFA